MGFRDDVEALKARREALRQKRQQHPRDPRWEAEWTALREEIDGTRTELAETLLDRTRIAKPCRADWYTMAGDDHVRECGQCDKRVYELSGLTAVEAAELLTGANGELCVRLYRRSDGTVMTSDCLEPSKRRWRNSLRVLGVAAAVGACVASGPAFFDEMEQTRRALRGPLRVQYAEMGTAPLVLNDEELEPGLTAADARALLDDLPGDLPGDGE